jgi:hypothetical protein
VANLAKVGREMVATTEDGILKQADQPVVKKGDYENKLPFRVKFFIVLKPKKFEYSSR